MEESIGLLVEFFKTNGLALTIIAIVGIVILGVLKYCNLFTEIEEKYRHYIYLGISVGLSIVGALIYLGCIGHFKFNYIITLSTAIYVLNQAFYAVFKITPINELGTKLLRYIVELFKSNKEDEMK